MAKSKKDKKPKKPANPKKQHMILEVKEYLDFKYVFKRNDLSQDVEVQAWDDQHEKLGPMFIMDDPEFNSIWIDLATNDFKCSKAVLDSILNSKMTDNYNPLKDYFNALPAWDGRDYIKELSETLTIADLHVDKIKLRDLWPVYLRKWLIGAACTATSYTDKQGKAYTSDLCMVLTGTQGKGKTRWLEAICPPELEHLRYTGHIIPKTTEQQTANLIAERFLIIIDDQLDQIFGTDFNSMKSIITSHDVTLRKSFKRFTKKRPRVATFAATVNNPKFLTDSQNRRYLVFTTTEVNYQHKVDINGVWAQALALLKQGEQYWLSQEEIKQLNRVNDIYRQISREEELLQLHYRPCERTNPDSQYLMVAQIMHHLEVRSGAKLSIRKISQALEAQGYGDPFCHRIKGGTGRYVYPVIELKDGDESEHQEDIKKEQQKTESLPF